LGSGSSTSTPITVLDDDATITISGAPVAIDSSPSNFSSRTGQFTLVLDRQPTDTVNVRLSQRENSLAFGLPGGFTFVPDTTAANAWNKPRTLTIEARHRASDTGTIDIAFSGGGYNEVTAEVQVRAGTTAEIANIPDPALRAGLEAALGKGVGEPIFLSELASLTSLRIRGQTIRDLAGLEHATNLTDLNLGFTGVGRAQNLSSLSALTRLTRLNLNVTGMSDLSPLSTLTALQRLELVGNGITDVSGIEDLSSLNALFLRDNTITNIELLVSGSALSRGDRVDLRRNPLNTAAYTTHISALLGRGMTVRFDICSRTDAVEAAILADIGGGVACDTVTIQQLQAIDSLDLKRESLTALRAGDFAGLTSLTQLELQVNQLMSLPEGVFNSLTSLEYLFLGANRLTSLPADVFDDLTNLQTLDLSINALESLRADAFDGLSTLQTLSLRQNQLTNLPQGVFNGLTNLRTLDLGFNRFDSLRADAFNGLSALWTLSLGQTMLTSLPEGMFNGLTNLQILDLSDGRLSSVGENLFSGLAMLASVDLSSNRIATLDSDAFAGLTMNNVTIQLQGNRLMSLPEGVFEGLQNATFQFVTSSTPSNRGVPFPLTLELARTDNADAGAVGPAEVKVRLAEGAPWDMTVELLARDGTLSATSATIDQGATESQAITVTGTQDAIATVMLGNPPRIDNDYATTPATFSIRVGEPLSLFMGSTRPMAEAGDNQIVDEGATVTLSGSGTDSDDNETLTYAWEQLGTEVPGTPTVDLMNADTATATFIVPSQLSTAAELIFQLTVTDGSGLTATDEVMITVRVTPRVIVTQPQGGVWVDEASGTGTYTIRLSTPPSGDVTVTPTIALPTGVTTDPISLMLPDIGGRAQTVLTFTTSNWNREQTVAVTGVPDAIDNGDQRMATITHAVAGGGYGGVSADDVAVMVLDDDTAGVTIFDRSVHADDDSIEATSVILSEASSRTGYSLWVRLDSQPTGNVIVTVRIADATVAMLVRWSIRSQEVVLTFTPDNWSEPQGILVLGVDDTIDNLGDRRTTSLTITPSGGDYDSVSVPDLPIIIIDNDGVNNTGPLARFAINPPGSNNLMGTSDHFYIDFTKPVSGLEASEILLTNARVTSLTRVSGGYGYTVQIVALTDGPVTVRVPANVAQDRAGNGNIASVTARVMATVNEGNITGPSGPVTGPFDITITFDTDIAFHTRQGGGPFALSNILVENGTASNLQGSGPVYTATITPAADGLVTVNILDIPSWRLGGIVAAGSDIAADAANAVVGNAGSSEAEQYMVTADLPAPGITLSRTALETNEDGDGNSAEYTVVLDTEPTAEVIVSLAINPLVARLSTTQLTFNAANPWNVPQTVTVTGINDNDANARGQRTATITHAASGGDYADVSATPLTVTVRDDDGSRIMLSSTEVTINEFGTGNSAEYTVMLDTEPTGPVTVMLTIDPPTTTDPDSGEILTGVVTVTPTDLTFNPTGPMAWNTPQTVTVTGVNDNVDNPDDQRRATVTYTASGSGYNTTSPLRVKVTDDDTTGVTLSRTSLIVGEAAFQRVRGVVVSQTATYDIRLNAEPTGPVTVTLASDPLIGVSPTTLNFNTQNWNRDQRVTVSRVDDMIDQDDQRMTTVTHTFDGGGYDDVTATVTVTVLDNNDFAGVLLSTAELTVAEDGGTETYTVLLNSAPTGTVTIAPTSSDTDVATVSGPLMFDSTNWNQPQRVTVTGINDNLVNDPPRRTASISHSVSGGGYDNITVNEVTVAVIDTAPEVALRQDFESSNADTGRDQEGRKHHHHPGRPKLGRASGQTGGEHEGGHQHPLGRKCRVQMSVGSRGDHRAWRCHVNPDPQGR